MKLVVKCCCCGTEQTSFELPVSDQVVRNEPLWTKLPCPPCEVVLAKDARERAYAEGGSDAIDGLLAMQDAGIDINIVHMPQEPPGS